MFLKITKTARVFKPVKSFKQFHSWSPIHHNSNNKLSDKMYTVNWILKDGTHVSTTERGGQSLLEIAHKNNIDLEGACEASLACSTCHVIVEDEQYYNKLNPPSDDENDMLDLAFGLTSTSRLGCQIILNETTDGITVRLPRATRNMAVDGFKPKPH